MPNLVYYKDSSGVVSGPLKEEEATTLFKANLFGPDHVFRIVDANNAEEFISIDDLRSLNGADTPFKHMDKKREEDPDEDSKELVRVYKELANVLKERNALRQESDAVNATKAQARKCGEMKKRMVEQFKQAIREPNAFSITTERQGRLGNVYYRFTNNTSTSVRCLIGESWIPASTKVVDSKGSYLFEGCKSNIYVAPNISDDPLDGSEHVITIPNSGSNFIEFK